MTQKDNPEIGHRVVADGIQTNYGQGFPVPWVYGRHGVGGQVIYTGVSASTAGGSLDDMAILVRALRATRSPSMPRPRREPTRPSKPSIESVALRSAARAAVTLPIDFSASAAGAVSLSTESWNSNAKIMGPLPA